MNDLSAMMTSFELITYENAGSFPEIQIKTTIQFQCFKQIQNIDMDVLKKSILDTVYFQSVSLKKTK